MGDRRLETLRQQDGDAFAGAHVMRGKPAGKGGRTRGEVAIGQRKMRAVRAEMLKTDALRITRGPGVAHGHADIEPLRDPPAEFAIEFVVVFDLREHGPAALRLLQRS